MNTDQVKRGWDVVVVGAGHNGLVAAGYLARAGLSVLVLERQSRLGGATCSAPVFKGLEANLSRYAYLVSLLPQAVVDDLGLMLDLRMRRIAVCAAYERDGKPRALLTSNREVDRGRSRASVEELGGAGAARGLDAFHALEAALAGTVFPSLLEPLRSRDEWVAGLTDRDQRDAWDWLVERPLGEAVEHFVADDLLRGILFTDAKMGILTEPHDPSLLQNRTFLYHVIGRGTGEWLVPVGGMGALVAELERAATGFGARIVRDARVDRLHPAADRVGLEVEIDGTTLDLDARDVLVNAGPSGLASMLGTTHVAEPEDEGSVAKVNMLLKRLPALKSGVAPEEAFAGTFRIDEGYEQMLESYREARQGRIPARPPAEVYCHTLTDPSILGPQLRASGCHTLTLFGMDVPYSAVAGRSAEAGQELLRKYVSQIDDLLAEPLEECLATDIDGTPCIEVKTAEDLERELGLDQGNIFHDALSWFYADGAEEPGTWGVETEHARVLRCGSSAARGGAVSGVPGHNAAHRVLEERKVS